MKTTTLFKQLIRGAGMIGLAGAISVISHNQPVLEQYFEHYYLMHRLPSANWPLLLPITVALILAGYFLVGAPHLVRYMESSGES